MVKNATDADRELDAISAILRALEGLDGESIQRTLKYVFDRLSLAIPSHVKAISTSASPSRPNRPMPPIGQGSRASVI